MTSWNQIKKWPDIYRHLNAHYNNNLPMFIRELFANLIEQQPWDDLLEIQFDEFGYRFINQLVNEIRAKINSNSVDLEVKTSLNDYCTQLSTRIIHTPFQYIKNIKEGIMLERSLLDKINVSFSSILLS